MLTNEQQRDDDGEVDPREVYWPVVVRACAHSKPSPRHEYLVAGKVDVHQEYSQGYNKVNECCPRRLRLLYSDEADECGDLKCKRAMGENGTRKRL